MHRVFRHPPAADENQSADDGAGDWIGDVPIEEKHKEARDDRPERAQHIADDVQKSAPHI